MHLYSHILQALEWTRSGMAMGTQGTWGSDIYELWEGGKRHSLGLPSQNGHLLLLGCLPFFSVSSVLLPFAFSFSLCSPKVTRTGYTVRVGMKPFQVITLALQAPIKVSETLKAVTMALISTPTAPSLSLLLTQFIIISKMHLLPPATTRKTVKEGSQGEQEGNPRAPQQVPCPQSLLHPTGKVWRSGTSWSREKGLWEVRLKGQATPSSHRPRSPPLTCQLRSFKYRLSL